jgi:hypothetical protein
MLAVQKSLTIEKERGMSTGSRRVNPHLFIDIFAVKFLEEHPENYLRLAKILRHPDVKPTIRLYGRKYDESHGARVAEDLLE